MTLEAMLEEMRECMSMYDLPDDILDERENFPGIGEFGYGVSMVPCRWVYPYLRAIAHDPRLEDMVEQIEYEYGGVPLILE